MIELRRRIMVSEGKSYPLGVWAYYADGSIRDYDTAETNAIGVAVVTANCEFVIDKLTTNGDNIIGFGGYNTDLSGIGVLVTDNANTAKQDFDGEGNTTKIINALGSGSYAASACRAAFSGKGYLGSLGEWEEAYANKSAIDSMMTKIGGAAIGTRNFWSSTLYDAATSTWLEYWGGSALNSSARNSNRRCRAFKAL